MNEDLIYYLDFVDIWWWFCISKILKKKIFVMMYDNYYHAEFHWIYNCIVADLYIQNLLQCLKQYITHCLKCLHYQIARHIIQSFAINNWILNFISYHHCWFHFQTFKNQFKSKCNDNNHLQVFQEDEIHFW